MQSELEKTKVSSKEALFKLTYTVDSFNNGVAFGQHKLEAGQDPRDFYALRMNQDEHLIRLRSRYVLHQDTPFQKLEKYLMHLSRRGVLASAQIYFGITSDPFLPFEGKFDASMKFLDLFQRYTPGLLVVQTRSPLLVIALPVFKRLGKHAAVTIGIETDDDGAIRRYTPGLPRIDERLKAASALRRFGVEVTLQVNPLLPYGDWKQDAARFARTLHEFSDYIHVRPLTDGTEQCERRLRSLPLAQKLAHDRMFHYMRPDSANPLISALESLAPEKLKLPERKHLQDRQIDMFAA